MTTAQQERLNRHLARRGISSRRGADELIAAGRVRVNGRPARVGDTVQARDRVSVDGRRIAAAVESLTLMLNKPAGVVTTRSDPRSRPTVMQLVPAVAGLVPVGRLDAGTTGLLLLTTEGDLAHRLTHPRYGLRRVYRVTSPAALPAGCEAALTAGVRLEDGPARALEARRLSARRLQVVMAEGRKREVRRMCAAIGVDVAALERVAFGPLRLGRLGPGSWRELEPGELAQLRRAAGLGASS